MKKSTKYTSLVDDVCTNSIVIDDETLERYKAKFSHIVNSPRAMYYIRTFQDLAKVLEMRAIDGRDREEFLSIVVQRSEGFKQRTWDRKEPEIPSNVLYMIADDIGRKWWDLAMHLELSDSVIAEIEEKYPNSLRKKAYEVLLTFCRGGGVGKTTKLLDALTKARHVDIRTRVELELKKQATMEKY